MNDDVLDDLLDRYEDSLEAGEPLSPEELCESHPELLEQLRERIAALAQIDGFFESPESSHPAPADESIGVASELTRLEFHAKGGLGAVYTAHEVKANRKVAVKFIHRKLVGDPESATRFALEAEVTGRLEHPGVVPLYGIGKSAQGRDFYYMRFIEGETLDDAIRRFHRSRQNRSSYGEQSVEFRRLLSSFVSACKTIAYAHNRGIVHRDIKPTNIMLGRYGETLVVDWGLAMRIAPGQRVKNPEVTDMTLRSGLLEPDRSGSGSGLGSYAYMSPEQAVSAPPIPAMDIYSLGATLYKILTGEPSLSGDQLTAQIHRQLMTGAIDAPSKRLSSVPAPLDAICRHAMSLIPEDRYQTASALAEDIERYLADNDVSVYRHPLVHRVFRSARKHQLAAIASLAGMLAVCLVTVIAAIWLGRLAGLEKEAREEAVAHQLGAEEIRIDNLKMSAKFLADSIAQQIDQRWRVMETARDSPDLIQLIQTLNNTPDNVGTPQQLQQWLSECKEFRNVFQNQESIWILYGEHGRMLARSPRNRIIGESYAHRDYFHAFGRDLAENDPILNGEPLESLTPHQYLLEKLPDHQALHSAHVSDVYQSTGTNSLQVTFTVPIWDRSPELLDKTAIGLFAISLQIQHLPLPANAMLVQLRPDQISHEPGLVISHRQLRPHTDTDLPPRIDAEVIGIANDLRQFRLRQLRQGPSVGPLPVDPFVSDFIDPVIAAEKTDSEPRFAAFEPVIVSTRPEEISDIGWLVIVTEK